MRSLQQRQMMRLQARPRMRVAWVWLAPRARARLYMSAAQGLWRRLASERVQRGAEPVIAGPAELGVFGFAGLDGDRALAGVGGECAVAGVALAAVADLGQQRGGANNRVR